VDDAFESQLARWCEDSSARLQVAGGRQGMKCFCTNTLAYRPTHTLREEQPPWDDIAVPWIDDGIDGLVKLTSVDNRAISHVSLQALSCLCLERKCPVG